MRELPLLRRLVRQPRSSTLASLGRRILRRLLESGGLTRASRWRPRALRRLAPAPLRPLGRMLQTAPAPECGYLNYGLPELWAAGGRVVTIESTEQRRMPVLPPDAWQAAPVGGTEASSPSARPPAAQPTPAPRVPPRAGVLRVEEPPAERAKAPSASPPRGPVAREVRQRGAAQQHLSAPRATEQESDPLRPRFAPAPTKALSQAAAPPDTAMAQPQPAAPSPPSTPRPAQAVAPQESGTAEPPSPGRTSASTVPTALQNALAQAQPPKPTTEARPARQDDATPTPPLVPLSRLRPLRPLLALARPAQKAPAPGVSGVGLARQSPAPPRPATAPAAPRRAPAGPHPSLRSYALPAAAEPMATPPESQLAQPRPATPAMPVPAVRRRPRAPAPVPARPLSQRAVPDVESVTSGPGAVSSAEAGAPSAIVASESLVTQPLIRRYQPPASATPIERLPTARLSAPAPEPDSARARTMVRQSLAISLDVVGRKNPRIRSDRQVGKPMPLLRTAAAQEPWNSDATSQTPEPGQRLPGRTEARAPEEAPSARPQTMPASTGPLQLAIEVGEVATYPEGNDSAATSTAAPVAQAPDLEGLARQVYQMLSRRLRTEFERVYGSQRR